MFYADQIGLDKVVARMKHYATQWGADFEPAPLLAELAASGKRFQDWRAA
jgi:3-hydroxyacyl-CoA dehydrogenase